MLRNCKLLLGWCCVCALLAPRGAGAEGANAPAQLKQRATPAPEARTAGTPKANDKVEGKVDGRTGAAASPALSAEDAALVRELALLEKVDLLKHLELFERDEAPGPARARRQR